MPKKAPKSGFYYFMLDYKENEENNGRRFPNGLKDVQTDPKCSEAWSILTAEERNRYNRRAKDTRQKRGRLTGAGESVDLLEKQKQEHMEYEANMKEIIDQSIKEADKIGNLDILSFYFIHVNHFYTKVSLDENWTDYIPAEYAVIEFSLRYGIKRIHHQIVRTEIQPGYTREYIEHSESTHKLSHNLVEGEDDYAIMYKNLVQFLKPDKTSNKFPPLYTIKKMKTIVPCLLERMAAAANADMKIFDLYSLEYLFGTLMGIANNDFPKTASCGILAAAYLEKDGFLWTPNIECFYHSEIEGTGPHCSQSIVQQWGFTIADYCCPRLLIELKPGLHCPVDDLVSGIESLKIQKTSTLKSDTGVSEAYRLMVGSRTKKDAERRKNPTDSLEIIDYGKHPSSTTIINPSVASAVSRKVLPTKKPRAPKTMATVFAPSDEVPAMNDDNFPAIGGRGKPRLGKVEATKPVAGRGRGGILMD